MQTVVVSIVTCDVCITDLHASAESCVKVSTVGDNISHNTSRRKLLDPLLYIGVRAAAASPPEAII